MFVCGDNRKNQLSLGYLIDAYNRWTRLMNDVLIQHISLEFDHNFIQNQIGQMFVFGESIDGQLGLSDEETIREPRLLMTDSSIQLICCCANFTLMKESNSNVFSCGANRHGQLDLGNTENLNVFQLINQQKKTT